MQKDNPAVYFEIPVTDIQRAMQFYAAVFGFAFDEEVIDNYQMALFPFYKSGSGITGALAKGDVYKPSTAGVIIYLATTDIENTLRLVSANGGKILYPKTLNEKYGVAIAEFEDSEGNRIALQQPIG